MCDLFLELSVDSSKFLSGEVLFFDDVELHKDAVFDSLIKPSESFDLSTKQCLELLFGSLSIITRRMLNDHLEEGKYDCPSETLRKDTMSVSTTNSLAERNFGMLEKFWNA